MESVFSLPVVHSFATAGPAERYACGVGRSSNAPPIRSNVPLDGHYGVRGIGPGIPCCERLGERSTDMADAQAHVLDLSAAIHHNYDASCAGLLECLGMHHP